ncbi:ubinuclein-1-like isoform X1 [Montipora capricornis]|uniref:ubinuclein-1-like isoform X1 n=1 Tax=Montipora capricornis TaxID=246305 RepID=UPI0035F1C9E0
MEKSSPFPSEIGDAFLKTSENVPTLRFTLSLTESDDKTCPEFSFLDLVKTSARKSSETPEKTSCDDDDGDDEKLKALAKKFEEKYAPKPKPKKRRRDRVEDLIDVTYGYDDTDPFVDDSEAYDELFPADWTTEHGGFYINQGALNFRPVSPGGESDGDDFQKAKKVKLKSPKKLPKVPKMKKVKDPHEKKERKKSTDKEKKQRKSSIEKEKKHKKKHSLGSANIATLLSSPSSSAKNAASKNSSGTAPSNVTSSPSVHGASSVLSNLSSPAKQLNSSQLSNEGDVKTEPGFSASVNNCSLGTTGMENTSGIMSTDTSQNTSLQNGIQSGDRNVSEVSEPSLPQCLPNDVEGCILRLKQAGTNGTAEGKCKFFNSDVNHMLLELETKSRALSSKVRSGIYEFLAHYLPCTKETLLKRAKKLLLSDQAGRLREPMAKLKAAVDRVMPEQIKRFEEEVRQHVEEESKKQSVPIQEGGNPDDHKKELFKTAMEVSDDIEKGDEVTTPTDPNAPIQLDDKAKKNVPKRKFIWTDELRGLLCDVVQMKIKIFEMSKTRAQSAEEFLKHFFENEVRPLWPKGWMTSRILFKESKQAHGKFTSVPAKSHKKPGPIPKKQGESPENQDSNAGNLDLKESPSKLSTSVSTTVSSGIPVPVLSGSTETSAISALVNLAQSKQHSPDVKQVTPAASQTVASLTFKPVVTSAVATKMETTAVSRPELILQAVPIITGLNLSQKDSVQKASVKSLPSLDNLKSKSAVTILDFADMISPEEGQGETSKQLLSQQPLGEKQQPASVLNKSPSSQEKPRDPLARDQPLTHLPSSVIATSISLPSEPSSISSAWTQAAMTSPPKITRSSAAIVASTGPSALLTAPAGNVGAVGLPNSFIALSSSSLRHIQQQQQQQQQHQHQKGAADLLSAMRQQQQKAATDVVSAMMQQQQQQTKSTVASAPPPGSPQTILDSITSPRRSSGDLKSCQAVPAGFTQGLSPQSIAMSLSSPVPSQPLHQSQPPNLTLFGTNLQGKVTTPLTHIGMVPSSTLQSAMLHLSRQSREQAGIVLPQNHFNQVLLGMSPTVNQSLPSLQLPHGALLSNQPVYQDPNQSSSSGTHQSPFLPRFS